MKREGYKSLCEAIVLQAIKDYRQAARRAKKGKNVSLARQQMEEVLVFINSKWFTMICDLDPVAVTEQLRKEADDDR